MKYNTNIPYKEEILFLANNFRLFTTDMLLALVKYNKKTEPKDKRDYARILATAASNKIISKTDKFRRSDYIDNNSIPRMCWTKYGN